ncbi:MAG: 50S ribosomal protein L25/general stress protein Ctc [Bacteroidetes bacterium]|nr:50S ribosomal protein L25/general stress protein Ctc [Bacteroidota bacterium]HET6245938.1 50S ribosomal protein L25/general stress protein Ctc [Bacteroidia bacterium]
MKTVSISGSPRENVGKKDAKAIRRNGQIPCVLYGGTEQIHFSADSKEFKDLIYSPDAHLVKLNVNGKEYSAALQEAQFHPVNDNILHVDFIQLFEDKVAKIDIPVNLIGTAVGVRAGGKLIKKQRLLKVRALPGDLPDSIEVNVENLQVGGIVRVKDISVKKLIILNSPSTVVATVKGKRGMDTAAAAAPAAGAKKK